MVSKPIENRPLSGHDVAVWKHRSAKAMKLQSNPLNSNSNQNRFFVVFVHTFTAILPSVTRTLDNSNLSLTGTNFHFPSSNFVDNFTLDKSNNVFQDEASKKIDIGY